MRLPVSGPLVVALGACFAIGAALPRAASAQQPAMRDSLLDHMIGRWTVTGTIRPQSIGQAATGSDSPAFTCPSTGTPDFHTTFAYDHATDSWRWAMDNDEHGTRKPFARLSMRRARKLPYS